MKTMSRAAAVFCLAWMISAAAGPLPAQGEQMAKAQPVRIIFLHHSTGNCVWEGGVPQWFEKYNRENAKDYRIAQRAFPSGKPYEWKNYPYDYWNIWVEHAGKEAYMEEPTLEMLVPDYDVIVFKHCFPVSGVEEDKGTPDVTSEQKTPGNYKLQYAALKQKLNQFKDRKFVVWTGAALTAKDNTPEQAARAREFFDWVKKEWDEPGDNIFVWDFFELETEGGLYLKDGSAEAPDNSHPSAAFSRRVAPYFSRRLVDVIEGRGDAGSLTGM